MRDASCKLQVESCGEWKIDQLSLVCLFSQFKEIKRYILGLNKMLLNDHNYIYTFKSTCPVPETVFRQ